MLNTISSHFKELRKWLHIDVFIITTITISLVNSASLRFISINFQTKLNRSAN